MSESKTQRFLTEKKIKTGLFNILNSINRFRKSSYLSIILLLLIFVLVQALDQANTLLVDMIERDKVSLALCFLLILSFSSLISHYPRYVYYAKNLNNSNSYLTWFVHRMKIFWFYHSIYTFKTSKSYKPDYIAKFLRHTLGLFIFSIWSYYIYAAFLPKFYPQSTFWIKSLTYFLVCIPFALLYYLSRRKVKLLKDQSKTEGFKTLWIKVLNVLANLSVLCFMFMLLGLKFNKLGYWFLQIFTFFLANSYVLFRLFREDFKRYNKGYILKLFNLFSDHYYYLLNYFFVFVLLSLILIISNVFVVLHYPLLNGMCLILTCFYLLYYLMATWMKHVFVLSELKDQYKRKIIDNNIITVENNNRLIDVKSLNQINHNHKRKSGIHEDDYSRLLNISEHANFVAKKRRWIGFFALFIITLVLIRCGKFENKLHELQIHKFNPKTSDYISKQQYISHVKKVNDSAKPLLFIAAQGGGLKANIWTMKILNELQYQTNGRFTERSLSFSGASGGMMGLSLYSVIEGQKGRLYNAKNNTDSLDIKKRIDTIINTISKENFASKDIAFTFGVDFIRKFLFTDRIFPYRDRSYYALRDYKSLIFNESFNRLDTTSFLKYWKDNIYDTKGHFPALLVNTAKTNGRRGVFCSLYYDDKKDIFLNSDNLSQLNEGAIGFYESVSTTNRFPFFSPAAKIKGYGHYIDAGAIDNNGLLTSLDFYYNIKDSIKEHPVVFVEIMNSKDSYINYLLEEYKIKNTANNQQHHIKLDEDETDNIIADLQTGLNLDKIPNYIRESVKNLAKSDSNIYYQSILLPFIVTIDDVESFLKGDIDPSEKERLSQFLKPYNDSLYNCLEGDNTSNSWQTYPPTLARHLSKSTVNYYDKVIKSDDNLKTQIFDIKQLLSQ